MKCSSCSSEALYKSRHNPKRPVYFCERHLPAVFKVNAASRKLAALETTNISEIPVEPESAEVAAPKKAKKKTVEEPLPEVEVVDVPVIEDALEATDEPDTESASEAGAPSTL